MNALTTTGAPLSGASALIPRDMRDAMALAEMMAKTGFLPREIQTPGGALFVMEQAMRWNMSPFAVATEVSFISGKPMFSGKIVAAAVQSSGVIQGRLAYDYSGEGDNRTVTVTGTLRGEGAPRTVAVRLADARTNNQHWTKSPDQMLAYHGARVWARRHAPEVMLGVYTPEEFDDEPRPAPREVPNHAAEAPPPAGSMREAVQQMQAPAAETFVVMRPDGSPARKVLERWLAGVGSALAMLESAAAVNEWRADMEPHIVAVEARDPLLAAEAARLIEARLAEFAPWPGPGGEP